MEQVLTLKELLIKEDFEIEWEGILVPGIANEDWSGPIDILGYIYGLAVTKIVYPRSVITEPYIEIDNRLKLSFDEVPIEYLDKLINNIETWQW